MMKKIAVFFSIGVSFLLAGCGHPFRDINQEELNRFTPAGWYNVVQGDNFFNPQTGRKDIEPLKVDLDSDSQDEAIIVIGNNNGCNSDLPARAIVLKYNNSKDSREKFGEITLKGNIGAISYGNIESDYNNDGIKEVNVYSVVFGCGSGNVTYKHIITVKDGKLIDLTKNMLAVQDGGTDGFVFKDQSSIYTIEQIRNEAEGEAHYGCHRYKINLFSFGINGFEKTNSWTTKYKYYTDGQPNPVSFIATESCYITAGLSTDLVINDAVYAVYSSQNTQ